MFSFHATKVFHTIEGGALTIKDSNIKDLLNIYKNFGITGPETIEYTGGNAKMNEFQAAMGLCNLRNIDVEIGKRKKVFERYVEHLCDIKGIKLLSPPKDVSSNYAYLPVVFDGFQLSRDEVYEKLMKHNIYSRKYFYPLTYSFECFKDKFNAEDTPVAKYIAERVLTLPLYGDLMLEDVDKICILLKE